MAEEGKDEEHWSEAMSEVGEERTSKSNSVMKVTSSKNVVPVEYSSARSVHSIVKGSPTMSDAKLTSLLEDGGDKVGENEATRSGSREREAKSPCRAPSRGSRQCRKHFREIIQKREQINEELEQEEGDLRQRLETLECTVPAVMAWKVWRMAREAPGLGGVRCLMEKHLGGLCPDEGMMETTPSRHWDDRVREVEAERKEASRRAEEARALLAEKEAAVRERRDRLEEAKKRNRERKEKLEKLAQEARALEETRRNAPRGEDNSCESGECGEIRCKERWIEGGESASSIGSTDLECLGRLRELAQAEICMKRQISELERREEAYMRTLHQADEMWSRMEGQTADTVGGLQDQLGSKTAANQELVERVRRLEDEKEALREKLEGCRKQVAAFTEKSYSEAKSGWDDGEAGVEERATVVKVKTAVQFATATPTTADRASTAQPETADGESSVAVTERRDVGTSAIPKMLHENTQTEEVARVHRAVDPVGELTTDRGADAFAESTTDRGVDPVAGGAVFDVEVGEDGKDSDDPWGEHDWAEGCPADTVCGGLVESATGMEDDLSKSVLTAETKVQAKPETTERSVGGHEAADAFDFRPKEEVQIRRTDPAAQPDDRPVAAKSAAIAITREEPQSDHLVVAREELRNWYNIVDSVQHTTAKNEDVARLADKMKSLLRIKSLPGVTEPLIIEDIPREPSLVHVESRLVTTTPSPEWAFPETVAVQDDLAKKIDARIPEVMAEVEESRSDEVSPSPEDVTTAKVREEAELPTEAILLDKADETSDAERPDLTKELDVVEPKSLASVEESQLIEELAVDEPEALPSQDETHLTHEEAVVEPTTLSSVEESDLTKELAVDEPTTLPSADESPDPEEKSEGVDQPAETKTTEAFDDIPELEQPPDSTEPSKEIDRHPEKLDLPESPAPTPEKLSEAESVYTLAEDFAESVLATPVPTDLTPPAPEPTEEPILTTEDETLSKLEEAKPEFEESAEPPPEFYESAPPPESPEGDLEEEEAVAVPRTQPMPATSEELQLRESPDVPPSPPTPGTPPLFEASVSMETKGEPPEDELQAALDIVVEISEAIYEEEEEEVGKPEAAPLEKDAREVHKASPESGVEVPQVLEAEVTTGDKVPMAKMADDEEPEAKSVELVEADSKTEVEVPGVRSPADSKEAVLEASDQPAWEKIAVASERVLVGGKPYLTVAKVEAPGKTESAGRCSCEPRVCPSLKQSREARLTKKLDTILASTWLGPDAGLWRRGTIWPRRSGDKSPVTTACVDTRTDSSLGGRGGVGKLRKDECTCSGVGPRKTEQAGGRGRRIPRRVCGERRYPVVSVVDELFRRHEEEVRVMEGGRDQEEEEEEEEIVVGVKSTGGAEAGGGREVCVDCGRPMTRERTEGESLMTESQKSLVRKTIGKLDDVARQLKSVESRVKSRGETRGKSKIESRDKATGGSREKLKTESRGEKEREKYRREEAGCSCPPDLGKKSSTKRSRKKRRPEMKDAGVMADIPRRVAKRLSKEVKDSDASEGSLDKQAAKKRLEEEERKEKEEKEKREKREEKGAKHEITSRLSGSETESYCECEESNKKSSVSGGDNAGSNKTGPCDCFEESVSRGSSCQCAEATNRVDDR